MVAGDRGEQLTHDWIRRPRPLPTTSSPIGVAPGRGGVASDYRNVFSAGLLLFVPREGKPGRDVVGERGGQGVGKVGG